jgi:magnesium transporter
MKKTLNDYITLKVPLANTGDRVDKVLNEIKTNDFDDTQQIFVVDQQNVLQGFVSLDKLLKSKDTDTVDKLLSECNPVDIDKSLEYVLTHAIYKKLQSVPVISKQGVFMGIIPTLTIIETLRNEHIEDLHKIAGIHKETSRASKAVKEPPLRKIKHRLPWLLVGLVGSFLATYIMAEYEEILNSNIALAFFIPGIVYLADAIGTQTETIVIRGLTLSWTSFAKILKQELFTGLMIGLILGMLSLPMALIGGFDIRIALVVGITITLAGMVASSIGLFLPWLLMRFGKDPAFGSGPLATIIQDILSIFIYLIVAQLIL